MIFVYVQIFPLAELIAQQADAHSLFPLYITGFFVTQLTDVSGVTT
jgi:hypothetical protein